MEGKLASWCMIFHFPQSICNLYDFFGVKESKSGKSCQENVLFLCFSSLIIYYIFNCDIFLYFFYIFFIYLLDYSQPEFVIKLDQLERKVHHLETLLHQYTGGRGIFSENHISPRKIPPPLSWESFSLQLFWKCWTVFRV